MALNEKPKVKGKSKGEVEQNTGEAASNEVGSAKAGKKVTPRKAASKKTVTERAVSRRAVSGKTGSKKASTGVGSTRAGSIKSGTTKSGSTNGSSTKAGPRVTGPKKGTGRVGADEQQSKRNPRVHRKAGVSDPASPGDEGTIVAQEQDPFQVARQRMKGSVPAIVEAMVEAAKQGSYTHAKTLLEMTGAKHMFDNEAGVEDVGEPWAKLVLERLDEAESQATDESLQEESVGALASH